MLRHIEGTDITFLTQLVNSQGQPMKVSILQWALLNELEEEIAGDTVSDLVGESYEIKVLKEFNTITSDSVRETRMLVVRLMDADGKIETQKTYYLIEKEATLVIGENSFITYLQCLKLVPSIPNLAAFGAATEEQQKAALSYAYNNIGRLSLVDGAAGIEVGRRHMAFYKKIPENTRDLEFEDFKYLPDNFKADLALAQIVEAEYLLGGDGIETLREKGIMSYTVGEVKQFYRTSKPLEIGVSKKALAHIGRYINYTRRIGRV
ncbi:hypothetical protein [Shewanella glacialipiscicola]|uniref:hypothetical protein n=1 Tax=Shewanella glacialipiscicola TaxID=614069 RepID=UPI003D7B6738